VTSLGLSGTGIVALMGLAQSILLSRYFKQTWRWIIASLVGWLVFAILVSSGAYLFPYERLGVDPYTLFLHGDVYFGATIGFVLAVPQWLMLRSSVREASWWIPISTLSYALALPVAASVGFARLTLTPYPITQAFGAGSLTNTSVILSEVAAVSGFVAGALTGLGLLWLIQHRSITEEGPRVETNS
jgi:hypothetical protein